jgi:hypothetical protein
MSAVETRMARPEAVEIAKAFVAELEGTYEQLIVAGSLRRRLAYIGDIEIVAVPKVETEHVETAELFGSVYSDYDVGRLDGRLNEMLQAGQVEKRLDANGSPRWGMTLKYLTFQGARVDLFTPHITCMKCSKMHTCTVPMRGQGGEANQEPERSESDALQAQLRPVRGVLREHQPEGVQQELQHEIGLQGGQEEERAQLLPGRLSGLPGAIHQEGLLQDPDVLPSLRNDPVGTKAEGPGALGGHPGTNRPAGAVPSGVLAGSSEQGHQRLRSSSSPGDGAPHRTVSGDLGEGSPPQRGEDRQPDREPGDRHARTPQRLGDLPALPKVVPGPLSHDGCVCPQCGGRIGSRLGWILLLRTGPAAFSRQLVVPKRDDKGRPGRTKDRRPGLLPIHIKPVDGWLTYRTSGERIETPTEQSVFDLFDIPYIEPWSRS